MSAKTHAGENPAASGRREVMREKPGASTACMAGHYSRENPV